MWPTGVNLLPTDTGHGGAPDEVTSQSPIIVTSAQTLTVSGNDEMAGPTSESKQTSESGEQLNASTQSMPAVEFVNATTLHYERISTRSTDSGWSSACPSSDNGITNVAQSSVMANMTQAVPLPQWELKWEVWTEWTVCHKSEKKSQFERFRIKLCLIAKNESSVSNHNCSHQLLGFVHEAGIKLGEYDIHKSTEAVWDFFRNHEHLIVCTCPKDSSITCIRSTLVVVMMDRSCCMSVYCLTLVYEDLFWDQHQFKLR